MANLALEGVRARMNLELVSSGKDLLQSSQRELLDRQDVLANKACSEGNNTRLDSRSARLHCRLNVGSDRNSGGLWSIGAGELVVDENEE
jgi:hypothetical protein